MEIKELYDLYKECGGISTDSRKIGKNSMFIALKGDNFDGNDFAVAALEKGAKYVLVSKPSIIEEASKIGRSSSVIVVGDTLKVMQDLACYHRKCFDIPVVAVTGTNGKTTTKELIGAVLAKKYNVAITPGNLNNHIGVPLTLFGIDSRTEMAVVEMGASAPGEIDTLAKVARPTCGLITSVGKAHLQGFGSFEGVKKAKGELYNFLRQTGGVAFYNVDNEILEDMIRARAGMKIVQYGRSLSDFPVQPVTVDEPFLRMGELKTHLVGNYNADNVLAAICVGRFFGVADKKIFEAVSQYVPSNNRSQMVKTENNMLIVDAYNANPTSMAASLDNFAATDFPDKVLILGDMLELGDYSAQAHEEILQKAAAISQEIYLVGKSEFRNALQKTGIKAMHFETSAQLADYFAEHPLKGKSILIKGSNGTRLTTVIEKL
ncbi:MAG: UDP-N-acetylmuramoyl-tripeptide--D-alanyl-D-alanine ligase [Bacteroidales bacterium]|nr:UDP-N-acetylmuramoyl-tripeptide--D-alanyl-D-alanine ligase [Bacteroidales bacterium]